MKDIYLRQGFDRSNIIQDGNRFLLGNGHIGYRGTLEEYGKEEMVALVIAGVYDQYKDKWRENLALPNPFFFKAYKDEKEISVLKEEPIEHYQKLEINNGVLHRFSSFSSLTISSSRIVSHDDDCLLLTKIEVTAKEDGEYAFEYGLDSDIYEIHGPHYAKKEISREEDIIRFRGITNEGKEMYVSSSYQTSVKKEYKGNGLFRSKVALGKDETITFVIIARVDEDKPLPLPASSFKELEIASIDAMKRKWERSKVEIEGDDELDFELSYSIYHCLILGDEKRIRSIAARGLSGQTYKGAIFWDTEIFLLPFFVLTNRKIARNLLLYRINTLEGAKRKAASLGYKGAFYAWESQDSGDEACRSDNVTDPKTGETVITYFGTKQIHISADIAYAIDRYIEATGDKSILEEGADKVLLEVASFFLSYSSLDEKGIRHINDVIGPDEYHERVNDEAFTLFMARRVCEIVVRYIDPSKLNKEERQIYDACLSSIWAKPIEKDGVIAEFDGYFSLEDIDVASLKRRVKDPKDYWGGKNGIATSTQVIKQADVISLLSLCPEDFDLECKRKNYEYYFSRTEHGSSLSASMHSLLAVKLNRLEEAYKFLRSSSSIDIKGAEKLFAGGVYIGGTHPAANAGAYLGMIFGFLGAAIKNNEITLDINLPKHISKVSFRYECNEKIYEITAFNDGSYTKREVTL